MNTVFIFLLFLIYLKLFLFWLWLWQLKEYHFGRFKAHFETQKTKKIISCFWRFKYPKFTKKIIVIFLFGVILGLIMTIKGFYFYIFFLIIIVPLFFQILTVILRNRILKKATKKREKFKDLIVIGITGSYGKTSFKEILASILSEKLGKDKVLKTKENQNSEMGISQTILNELKPEHKIFVCEIGAYNKGIIKLLTDIIKPKIGILTGINEQHMSTFGSQENIIQAKYELIESLPSYGMAFFNGKNKYCCQLYEKTQGIKKFLYGQEAVLFNEENILGAIAVAKELGIVINVKPKLKELEIKKGINGLKIIDSTYSANPDSVIAHLEYLKTLDQSQKLVIVMPCLIELGSASKQVHNKIGEKINEVCDLAIITTKDRFKEIKEKAGEKAVLIEKPKEILKKIMDFCNEQDIILLEGRMPKELLKQLNL